MPCEDRFKKNQQPEMCRVTGRSGGNRNPDDYLKATVNLLTPPDRAIFFNVESKCFSYDFLGIRNFESSEAMSQCPMYCQ